MRIRWRIIIIALAIIVGFGVDAFFYSDYIDEQAKKQEYIEYMEKFQADYLIRETDSWENAVKLILEGKLDPSLYLVNTDTIDIIHGSITKMSDNPYFRDKFLGAGKEILLPLAMHISAFGGIANEIPPEMRTPCYMVHCDLLSDMCRLWELEMLYAYDEISIQDYYERVDKCKYININYGPFHFEVELVQIEVMTDGSIKGFDPVEWAEIRGLEYDEEIISRAYISSLEEK